MSIFIPPCKKWMRKWITVNVYVNHGVNMCSWYLSMTDLCSCIKRIKAELSCLYYLVSGVRETPRACPCQIQQGLCLPAACGCCQHYIGGGPGLWGLWCSPVWGGRRISLSSWWINGKSTVVHVHADMETNKQIYDCEFYDDCYFRCKN